ncbi:MAG: hypothetical protein FWF45_05590 [Coriobacteriia bacterium]|nr:hypothetical protein [Coriobacteriia bacterium]
MAMERRLPAQENSLDDLINQMLANRTSEIKKQEEETARVSEEAGLVPETDPDLKDDPEKSDQ